MTTRIRYSALAAIAAATLLAGTATARAGRYELSIGATDHHMSSPSMDALTASDAHTLFSADAAVGIGRLLPGVRVAGGIEYEGGTISDSTFQTIETKTELQSAIAFARIERDLRWQIRGFARAGIGFSHVAVTLDDVTAAAEALRDGGFGMTTMAAAGAEYTPFSPRNRLALALRAEVGYSATSNVSLRAVPSSRTGNGDAITIPAAYASLGDVNVSGWTFRIGLVARF